jgi:hypothetical protein
VARTGRSVNGPSATFKRRGAISEIHSEADILAHRRFGGGITSTRIHDLKSGFASDNLTELTGPFWTSLCAYDRVSEAEEERMSRKLLSFAAFTILLIAMGTSAQAAQYGSADEAKAMLNKAVEAVKQDKAKALDMFNKGEDGFKDRDLYVFCANASDGIVTAHPTAKGEQLRDIKGKKGFPLGKEMMEKATEGQISEVTYWWPPRLG